MHILLIFFLWVCICVFVVFVWFCFTKQDQITYCFGTCFFPPTALYQWPFSVLLKYFPLIRPMYLDKGEFTREEGLSNKDRLVREGSGPHWELCRSAKPNRKRECRQDLSLAVLAPARQATLPSWREHSRGTCVHCPHPLASVDWKKTHNMIVASSVRIGAKWGLQTWVRASGSSGRQLQRGRGERLGYICDFGEGEYT